MRAILLVIITGVTALLWSGCEDQTAVSPGPAPAQADTLHGPLENYEAEALAVLWSRELVAPMPQYLRFKNDLERIRSEYGGLVPAVNITHRQTAIFDGVGFKATPALVEDTTTVTFRVLDSLNQIYRATDVVSYSGGFFRVRFAKRYNSVRMVEIYSIVPGLDLLYGGGPRVGDGPDVYVAIDPEVARYFFREAWGDCPAGCIYSRVHYLSVTGNECTYHGFYLVDYGDSITPVPAWMDTVRMAREHKWFSILWTPDSVVYWP